MQLWLATGNRGKLREFSALLRHLDLELHSQAELSTFYPPEESGSTFLDNARIKAKSLAAVKPGHWVFADDSGLTVEGLGGLPGVHSARYAGNNASDIENRSKLLKMMKIRSAQNRQAAFLAVIVLLSPEGQEFVFEGRLDGTISQKETGKGGFGYDPVFIPEGEERTLAEMEASEKNQVSHRSRATEKMIATLNNHCLK